MLQMSPQRSLFGLNSMISSGSASSTLSYSSSRIAVALRLIDDELHAILMENGAVRQHVRELEGRVDVSHEHGAGLDRLAFRCGRMVSSSQLPVSSCRGCISAAC